MEYLVMPKKGFTNPSRPRPQFWGDMKPALTPAPPELGRGGGSPGFVAFISGFGMSPQRWTLFVYLRFQPPSSKDYGIFFILEID
jgi:hypothetical protein